MDGLRIGAQLEYVRGAEDFIDLVSKYMGADAEKYLEALINDYEHHVQALHEDIRLLEAELSKLSNMLDDGK